MIIERELISQNMHNNNSMLIVQYPMQFNGLVFPQWLSLIQSSLIQEMFFKYTDIGE